MRDKLIELINGKLKDEFDNVPLRASINIADHLIANKVFVLPENVGGNWELGGAFLMRLFVADEAEIEKIKQEFELQKIKKILTDICNYLNERKYSKGKSDYAKFCETALADLAEYAEKLGVEL